MPKFTPEVDIASEFLEISSDFGDPREIIREAISNSFDAGAKTISITALVDRSTGVDELVVILEDDGEGMNENQLRQFYGLGFTRGRLVDNLGRKISKNIGEKGHGTKIYFNSRQIEVETVQAGKCIKSFLDNPRKNLRVGKLPEVEYELKDSTSSSNTKVIVRGYNDNNQVGFSHDELKDYIYWFTKFGSCEKEAGHNEHANVVLKLSGLGWREIEPELLSFGHPFPKVNTSISKLRVLDKVEPLDFYVARWVFRDEPVINFPTTTIDIIFYIEGDKAKRTYNKMIHEPWSSRRPGQYTVGNRYGLWLCKDHLPIERRDANSWVSEKTEWTKYHSFVNCQDFRLTANRGDIGNTPPPLLDTVRETVKNIFNTRIKPSPEFKKYQLELEKEKQSQTAQKEEKEFERRKRATLAKRTASKNGVEFFEPRQESGVYSLVLQLLTLDPTAFGFKVVDYDTSIGYDLLVTKDLALDLNRASMMFCEVKFELKRDFDHSFKRLGAVICWDTRLSNDDEVIDLTGAKRTMKITPRDQTHYAYTKYMLVSSTEHHNIEVFVLKDFLGQRFTLESRPRTAAQK